jgi:hypothetical protein
VHGVHHDVQRRVQKPAGLFGIKTLDQLGRALEVGKEHGDLFALAFQGAFGGEDLLSEIGWDVSAWCLSGGLHGSRGG